MTLYSGRANIFPGNVISHRGKTITDIGSSADYKDFLHRLENFTHSKVAIIPSDMEVRPDKLSYAAYGTEKLWWLIVLANQVYDYEVDLAAGTQILIPQT